MIKKVYLFIFLTLSAGGWAQSFQSVSEFIDYTYKNSNQPSSKELSNAIATLELAKDTIKSNNVWKIKVYQCLVDYYFVQDDFQNALKNSLSLQYFIKTKEPKKLAELSELYYKTGILYAGKQNKLKALEYYQKGITEVSKQTPTDYWCKNLDSYVNTSITLNKINDDLIARLKELSVTCLREDNYRGLGNNYSQLAIALAKSNQKEVAITYHRKAYEAYKKANDIPSAATALNNIGYLSRQLGNYQEAIEPLNTANSELKSIPTEWPEVYNNLGVNYAYLNNFSQAEVFFYKALTINNTNKDKKGIAESYNYLALSNMLQNNTNDARDYVKKAIDIGEKENYKTTLAESYLILSKIDSKEGNYRLSQENENTSVKIMDEMDQATVSKSKREQELHYESEKVEKEILNKINEKEKSDLELAQLKLLAEKEKQEKESEIKQQILLKEKTEQSLLAARRQIEIQTKILEVAKLNEEKQNQTTAFLQKEKKNIEQQKDRELKSLAEKNKLQEEKKIEQLNAQQSESRQQLFLIGFIIVFGLLLLALLAFVRNRKQKKMIEKSNVQLTNFNEEIVQQKNVIEHKNTQISESINYAKNIQNAILPQERLLNDLFSESMMVYIPKDNVSGDFPWVYKKEDDIYVAAVDCTGHGVPGALLSIIGYFVLNEVVIRPETTNAGLLLDGLHKGIKRTLKQEENIETRDGMDVAMCKFNLKDGTLDYSGAHRHMYLIRNGECMEYKGTKRPVGGIQYKDDVGFTNHQVPIQKGDTIYVYSDGFADQIGGDDNKKFFNSRMKEMILTHSQESLVAQKNIFTTIFHTFRGKHKQIDDILLMAIKI
jgi:serine phosphatase RsbU (regulator of sigma subunit)/tetratricopeptide (TPR) repeat protein